MKVCSVCHRAMPVDAFPIDRRDKSGRAGRCAECNRAARRASYRYRHPESAIGYTPDPRHLEASRALRRAMRRVEA